MEMLNLARRGALPVSLVTLALAAWGCAPSNPPDARLAPAPYLAPNQASAAHQAAVSNQVPIPDSESLFQVFLQAEPTPPPASQPEVVVDQPGPDYQWISGDYEWEGNWVWTAGRWEAPPYRDGEWVRGHWRQDDRGFTWERGRWR